VDQSAWLLGKYCRIFRLLSETHVPSGLLKLIHRITSRATFIGMASVIASQNYFTLYFSAGYVMAKADCLVRYIQFLPVLASLKIYCSPKPIV